MLHTLIVYSQYYCVLACVDMPSEDKLPEKVLFKRVEIDKFLRVFFMINRAILPLLLGLLVNGRVW